MEKQYGLLGPYKMVPNLKHNRRPVWKNSLPQLLAQYITQNLTSDQQYLFYNQDLRGNVSYVKVQLNALIQDPFHFIDKLHFYAYV